VSILEVEFKAKKEASRILIRILTINSFGMAVSNTIIDGLMVI
jgi:hypothetical protein